MLRQGLLRQGLLRRAAETRAQSTFVVGVRGFHNGAGIPQRQIFRKTVIDRDVSAFPSGVRGEREDVSA